MPELHQIDNAVRDALWAQPVLDIHTHLYPSSFGTPVPNRTGRTDADGLMLWGIDELLTYHYLVAEVFRVVPASRLPYEKFWRMSKTEQADHIFKWLFLERTPLSEACRGVVTTLTRLGLDPSDKSLDTWRRFFAQQDPDEHIDRVMSLANVSKITMTNNVFDEQERRRWLADPRIGQDKRFSAVLRIDPLVREFASAGKLLGSWGYRVEPDLSGSTMDEVRRFLNEWIDRMRAVYVAMSLPNDWRYSAASNDAGQKILTQAVFPVCIERRLPVALMIGVSRRANPQLQSAGDMVGKSDVASVVALCREFPDVKVLVTMLGREDQHELAVAARKFGNLMPFGCWWFLNNPSLIEQITRMRMELLGTSFVPQHSDARVLEQLIYKWDHSRTVIARVLADKYCDLHSAGWRVTSEQIRRDVQLLLETNFTEFLTR